MDKDLFGRNVVDVWMDETPWDSLTEMPEKTADENQGWGQLEALIEEV